MIDRAFDPEKCRAALASEGKREPNSGSKSFFKKFTHEASEMGTHVNWIIPTLAFLGAILLRIVSGKRLNGATLFAGMALAGGSFLALRAIHTMKQPDGVERGDPNRIPTNTQRGNKPRFDDEFHQTWMTMSQRGDVDATARFLNEHPEILRNSNQFDPPLICDAAANCEKRILALLLSLNPDLAQARDSEGKSPLHYAMRRADYFNAELLLFGDNAQGIAGHSDSATSLDRLGRPPLYESVDVQERAPFEFMLSHFPSSLSFRDQEGRTILHYAIDKDALSTVRHFCGKSMDYDSVLLKQLFNAKDSVGQTPLNFARKKAEAAPSNTDRQEIYQLIRAAYERQGMLEVQSSIDAPSAKALAAFSELPSAHTLVASCVDSEPSATLTAPYCPRLPSPPHNR